MLERKQWRKIAVIGTILASLATVAADCAPTPQTIACNCDNEVRVTEGSSGSANATQTCLTQENGMRACATSKFQYELTPGGNWTLAVTEGTVYVTSAERTVSVHGGQQTQFNKGQLPNAPSPIVVPIQGIPLEPQTFRINEGAITFVSSETVNSARLLTVLAPSVESIQGPAGAEFKVNVVQSGNTTVSSVNKTITVNVVGQPKIMVAPNQILPIEIRRSITPAFQLAPTPTISFATVVIRTSPRPNPTQAPAPTSPSSAAQCGGVTTGGYCWYLGAENASCDTVCSTHGGYNDGTRLFAGSSGNTDNCKSVLNALKIPFSQFYNTSQGGLGCFAIPNTSGNFFGYWDQQPTTSSATTSTAGRRRACACQR